MDRRYPGKIPVLSIAWLLAALVGCAGTAVVPGPAAQPAIASGAPAPLPFPEEAAADAGRLSGEMQRLAADLLGSYADAEPRVHLGNVARLQLLAGQPAQAIATLDALAAHSSAPSVSGSPALLVYRIHAHARLMASSEGIALEKAFGQAFREAFANLDDRQALDVAWYLGTPGFVFERQFQAALAKVDKSGYIAQADALALARAYLAHQAHAQAEPWVPALITEDDQRRYVFDDDVLIPGPDGATLSAMVVRPRVPDPRPSALLFTIYTDQANNRQQAKSAAARGYVGVVADTRGKRLSPDAIVPYEHEAKDTVAVIDWISRQPWSNGDVGMYGASYSGFAAWAATKQGHPALKTIVTSVAALPGLGLPMSNNIFLNANYGWGFYVTNNRGLDHAVYNDPERWQALNDAWYASGRPYREIDQIDGTPNALLQRWLDHPAYDEYWQSMVPYGREFANVDLPVLTITGYYDDGQISALHYLREHYAHRPDAEHYLVIGPYDHFGAQGSRKPAELRGYAVDPVAQFDTQELTFQWLDHVLRGAPRPALLGDRINYQVMGSNTWRHAPSLEAMSTDTLRLYLVPGEAGAPYHQLAPQAPAEGVALEQVVDLADRTVTHNDYYPDPIQGREASFPTGLAFISAPMPSAVSVNGPLGGELKFTVNKQDLDIGVVLYELMPDGTLFHLSYYLGRASFARDMSTRTLLEPGKETAVMLDRSTLVSRQLREGSRLLVVLDVNKNPFHQINYGTGKDVSDESIADAGSPLVVAWASNSYVEIPISR